MKKLLSLALALVMILSLSVTAFADTEIAVNPTGAGNKNVTGKYVAGAAAATIYKIDISWGSMAFTYTSAGKGTWDTDDHTYKNATAAGWSWAEGANKITVTNHSNDGITVTPSYTPDSGYETATMAIAPAALSLGTADNGENGAAGTATNGTITVTPSGSIPEGTSGKIGQITLSIAGTDGSSAGGETTDDKAVITGVEVKVGDTTYKSGDTVTLTSEGEVAFIVKGTNLQNGNANTNLLFFAPNVVHPVTSEDWVINTEGTEATCSIYYFNDQLATLTTAYEILYTNDGDTTCTCTGSGVQIIYENSSGETTDDTAVITGVEVKVGDTTYQSGDTVTLNADSGDVTIIVKGRNLQNGVSSSNKVQYRPGYAVAVASGYRFTFSDDGTEATRTYSSSDFADVTTSFELQYTNEGSNWVGSGVQIIYENSSGDTSVSTPEDLTSSLSAGGDIKLANDITLTSYVDITNTVTLDLNNCTLTAAGNGLYVNSGASLTIKNGTVVNADSEPIRNDGGNVNVENCTLTGQANAFNHYSSGTSTLKNCTVNGVVLVSGSGTITLSGSINFGSGTAHNIYKGIEVLDTSDGSVICHFDPTDNVKKGTATSNGDGTYTVTANS